MPRPNHLHAERADKGKFKLTDALARFVGKCAFDPYTGCVMWIGTTSHGHGRTEPYGRFWFEGKFWLAHRWAAVFIHGFNIDELEVDHCCPCGPSTLCVHHIEPRTEAENKKLRSTRTPRPAVQLAAAKRYWLFVQLGIEDYEPTPRQPSEIPFYSPPAWLRPFLREEDLIDDVPF